MADKRNFIVTALLLSVVVLARAQGTDLPMDQPVGSMDLFRGVLLRLGQSYQNTALCFGTGESVATVRPVVEEELKRRAVAGLPTPRQVLDALLATYPCPFSAAAVPARPAAEADLQGTWIAQGDGLKLRYPPRSPGWTAQPPVPLQCEVRGFYEAGESRTLEVRGVAGNCPAKAADFQSARAMPRVVTWSLPEPGRLLLTRSDIPNHRQQWDVYVVERGFERAGVRFEPGDLLAYLRVTPEVSLSYAMQFRHFQKLP